MYTLYKLVRTLLEKLMIYKVYEKILERHVSSSTLPQHIGIILDGNRRWAKSYGYSFESAYREGAKKVEEVAKWCRQLGIKSLTVFVLSTENFRHRSREELESIFTILKEHLQNLKSRTINECIRIKFIGDVDKLDEEIKRLIREVEKLYSCSDGFTLNIALVYGGKWDILNATRQIAEDVAEGKLSPHDINQSVFQKYLSTSHLDNQDLDLVLRTGGEMRISNFLLWQIAYSELVFLDVFWPDFRKIDFLRAIRIYQQRSRRFGK